MPPTDEYIRTWCTHIHTHTNTLRSTGTCFSHQTGLFQVLYLPRLYESKAAIGDIIPWQEALISAAHILPAQPISPHPPSARWAGTCTAAVGSEPASSGLPPARAPSSASPPEPQWSEENGNRWQKMCLLLILIPFLWIAWNENPALQLHCALLTLHHLLTHSIEENSTKQHTVHWERVLHSLRQEVFKHTVA